MRVVSVSTATEMLPKTRFHSSSERVSGHADIACVSSRPGAPQLGRPETSPSPRGCRGPRPTEAPGSVAAGSICNGD